jgi:hypothetical protein
MSNTIPEPRVNKLGHTVIKHVRADNQTTTKRSKLPSPAPQKSRQSELVSHVRKALDEDNHGFYDTPPRNDLYKHAKTLSEDTMSGYLRAIEKHPDEGYADLLVGILAKKDSDQMAAYSLVITEMDPNSKNISAFSKGYDLYDLSSSVFDGLENYKAIGFEPAANIFDESDPEVVRTRALLNMTIRLTNAASEVATTLKRPSRDEFEVVINPPDLVQLVLDRPQDSDKIVEIILDENIKSADHIRAMLEAPVRALRDGAL